jgi:4'-phosphopantetheinyl transferase EntD
MLEVILPAGVESQEYFGDPPGGDLFSEEEQAIAHAVASRRRDYTAVRGCARACLTRLGYPPAPILPGAGGAPTWPVGIRGSMTHCTGYAAAAVGLHAQISTIGIDAEPDKPLPDGVLDLIATPAEQDRLAMIQPSPDSPNWDRLLFSAKEAVYKAWYPLVGNWLDHHDAEISIHPHNRTLTALLLRDDLILNNRPTHQLHGHWTRGRGIVLTAIILGPTGDALISQ